MERVTVKVAKALKEAGYPQGQTDKVYIDADCYDDKIGTLVEHPENYWEGDIVDAPYAMEAWLWLWQEKGIKIELSVLENGNVCSLNPYYPAIEHSGPEEVIIWAIEYLVEHKLLK